MIRPLSGNLEKPVHLENGNWVAAISEEEARADKTQTWDSLER